MAIGFGIIGCGMISRFHSRAIDDLRGTKLVACYDRVPQAAESLASETGCRAYGNLKQMLADKDVDVVTICTPSGAHLEPCIDAARAGKHVIVEKPLEITLRRCDRMIQECKKQGVVLSTIFPSRFHASSVEMKRAIDQGRFGKLTLGDAYVKWYRSKEYYESGAWRGTWKLDGGGALMNQAIHSVDLLIWLMGPIRQIRAHAATLVHRKIGVEDVASASLQFANGALGTIEATTTAWPGFMKRIEIHGAEGTAMMEEEDIKVWDFARKNRRDAAIRRQLTDRTKSSGGAADPAAIGHHGHTAQFKDVLTAIRKSQKPAVDGAEGRRAVEVILGIYKAAETGRSIELPLKNDPVLKARKRDRS